MKRPPVLAALAGVAGVIGLVALAALSGGRRAVDPDLPGEAARNGENPAAVSAASPPAPAQRAEVAPSDANARDRSIARAAPPPPPPPPDREPLRFRIEGRVVTESDVPIEGAEVRTVTDRLLVVSDRGGDVAADVELDPQALGPIFVDRCVLLVFAAGREGAERRAPVRAGETVRLGTVRLGPGGEVTGRVLDELGLAIHDADVSWRRAVDFPEDVDDARENGVGTRGADFLPHTSTERDGVFRLRGVPAGEAFLVGWAPGKHFGWTEVFSMGAGEVVQRDLVLESTGELTWKVTGRVLLPDGSPLPRAELELFSASGSVGYRADDDGRFELEITGPGNRRVVARDPERRSYPAVIQSLEPRDQEIELMLGAPEWIEVVVADPEGAPIPWSNVRALSSDEGTGPLVPGGEEGRATMLLPRERFELEAFAPGFRTETFGPFEPDVVVGPLVLRMTPGQAVRGRITFRRAPVAGARVTVSQTAAPGVLLVSQAVTSLEHPFQAHGTTELRRHDATTDARGRFLVTLHQDGWHSLRVEGEGFPLQVFGPYDWTMEQGARGLELELRRGGAVEGRVLTAPGVSPAGRVVGASDGWNVVHSSVVEDDGRYRIDDLAPGSWQVRVLEPPVASLQSYGVRALEEAPEIAWDCAVRAGETTAFDLDLTSEGAYVLAGHFAWKDAPLGEGRARLDDANGMVATTGLDPDGRFELKLSDGGTFTLVLWTSECGQLFQEVELFPGRNEWSVELDWGSLRIKKTPGEASGGPRFLRFVWSDPSGLHLSGLAFMLAGEENAWERVPTGTYRLELPGEDGYRGGGTEWGPWKEVEVRAGEETVVEFP